MCGIAGYMGPAPLTPPRCDAALASMASRGPDGQQAWHGTIGNQSVSLLHARLSIIDLNDRADQPFRFGPLTLVFNGEIYNYRELRADLTDLGHRFQTASDTEVLLTAYRQWGPDCLDRLEGMWAFCIHDADRQELFLARDRFGEKPLLYSDGPDGFFFASELKTLAALTDRMPEVDTETVRRFLVNGYKSLYKSDQRFHRNVHELPAGASLTLVHSGRQEVREYWRPEYRPRHMSFADAAEGVRHHLTESMRLRLRADVPIAFCLSGGLDSAALTSLAARGLGQDVATYSIIDADERYNEEENIMATVRDLECRHTLIRLEQETTLDRLDALTRYHDQPVATISYYVHSLLSEAMQKDGIRVSMSGTAADELVTGYYDHYNLHLQAMDGHADQPERIAEWRQHLGPIVLNPHLKNPLLYRDNPGFRDHIYLNNDVFSDYLTEPFQEPFVEQDYSDNLLRNRMLNELRQEAVPVILREDDLNSMKHSIENRSPYLDRALVDFCYTIPPEHLIRDGFAKMPLRAATKGILNDHVRLDRRKKGFNAAFASVFDLENPDTRDRILSPGPIFDIVKREAVESALKMTEIPNSFSKFLFSFVTSKLFMEHWA